MSRILVVDDAPHNVRLLQDLLAARGYQTEAAASGNEALRKIDGAWPDLVLLDVVMPDMSGYEVCRAIRERSGDAVLPVILVTALDPAEERIKGLDAGADDFLSKPINQAELFARVRSLLRIKALYDKVQQQTAELAALNAGLERRVREQLEELQHLSQLRRFFPRQLAELIVAGDVDNPLETHRSEVTVVFLDMRGFTSFADSAEPEEVMNVLREYHEEMGRILHAHEGVLEHFAGDGMMIMFNDPVRIEDPAGRAVTMAVAMRKRFSELQATWRRRGHEVGLGIGIAHGYATIGAIGYEARMGIAVTGRVTNMAARLCAEAKDGQVLVNQTVLALVEDRVKAEDLGPIQLKGFARPLHAFNVIALR